MAHTRIQQYVDRLRLSQGDLLALAREVTEDATLRTIDNMTEVQTNNLIQLLAFLAEPIRRGLPETETCGGASYFGGYRAA